MANAAKVRRPGKSSSLRSAVLRGTASCALVLAYSLGCAAATNSVEPVRAPSQQFKATAAGSYRLPVIQPAANGWVFDRNWIPRRLSAYTHGKITLLSFVYTYCSDPLGCPLVYTTLHDLKQRIVADAALLDAVRFVSISFDPTNDTPSAMATYGSAHADSKALEWAFLTTYSTRFLQPILDEFGQDAQVELDAHGRPTRVISHLVKLFLIDERGNVREIYGAQFLHPEVLLNDIRTLWLERRTNARLAAASRP
jgi:protein SCO1